MPQLPPSLSDLEALAKRALASLPGRFKSHLGDVLIRVEDFPDRETERARIRDAGLEHIHFGWAGSTEPRRPHYYRLHGPNLLIEYDNTQNDANHIHSVWHDPGHDFATDLLRRHYQHHRHRAAHHIEPVG